jgi:hypothetical protein
VRRVRPNAATIKFTERSVAGLPTPTGAAQACDWDEELTGLQATSISGMTASEAIAEQ